MQPPGNATQNACPPKLHHATRQNTPTPFPPLLNLSITRINNYPKCTITFPFTLLGGMISVDLQFKFLYRCNYQFITSIVQKHQTVSDHELQIVQFIQFITTLFEYTNCTDMLLILYNEGEKKTIITSADITKFFGEPAVAGF